MHDQISNLEELDIFNQKHESKYICSSNLKLLSRLVTYKLGKCTQSGFGRTWLRRTYPVVALSIIFLYC